MLCSLLAERITCLTGQPFHPRPGTPLSGGCINETLRLEDGERRYFVKLNGAARADLFAAEAAGLEALSAICGPFRVPRPLEHGVLQSQAYLIMDYMPLGPRRCNPEAAGQALASLHRVCAPTYGWHRDNYIGATPQPNGWIDDWPRFWAERRLGFQLQLAHCQGAPATILNRGERLVERLPALLDHQPPASLLHGDLWTGNLGYDDQGRPVIYDPAVYYGDRETDLAMTELFGGFGPRFYAAYRESWPLDSGYRARKTLYNLYHILNHHLMFGGGYLAQAAEMIERLLAETG